MKLRIYVFAILALFCLGTLPAIAGQGADYLCPMHTQVHGYQGEKCPICGMELVAAKPGQPEHDHFKAPPSVMKISNSVILHVPAGVMLKKGKPVTIKVQLASVDSNQPISTYQLKEVHTQRFHALIIDKSLSDYHHVHPVETSKKGEYSLSFTPQKSGDYRMWADVTPTATDKQEYVIGDLNVQGQSEAVSKKLNDSVTVDGLTFKLSFDGPLQAGQATMGMLRVMKDDKPFNQLEPIMGAYAHIVGFNEDFKTVAHIHPMGKEPTDAKQRGGPDLEFHIEPSKPGFTKLFAQIRVNSKEIFAPFGLMVEKAK
ncbi:MAG TPA: heavy metal-binding domain-containing protein [Cellvibrio sp.]|jgi:hypothetical protein